MVGRSALFPRRCVIAAAGIFGGDDEEYVDAFGHPYHTPPAVRLARLVTAELGHRARFERHSDASRMSISMASMVDLTKPMKWAELRPGRSPRGPVGAW